MLALNFIPCGDVAECNKVGQSTITTSHEDQEHDHATEVCTPFCICACCATQVVYPAAGNTTILANTLFPSKVLAQTNDRLHSCDLHSIWQPPRFI